MRQRILIGHHMLAALALAGVAGIGVSPARQAASLMDDQTRQAERPRRRQRGVMNGAPAEIQARAISDAEAKRQRKGERLAAAVARGGALALVR